LLSTDYAYLNFTRVEITLAVILKYFNLFIIKLTLKKKKKNKLFKNKKKKKIGKLISKAIFYNQIF